MVLAIDTSGLHPSTELCLAALEWLDAREEFGRVLDMGCGSGVLSLAAASIWDAEVLAVDISEKAVRDTQEAALNYELEDRVTALRSDLFAEKTIAARAPYDLILCNMLAELQLQMAHDIKKHVKSNGYVLLAGILSWKLDEVKNAFNALGFEIAREWSNSPWHALVLRHQTVT